jgi:hypothetical protein
MRNLTPVKQALRCKYAWPGGYPLFLVMTDGAALSIEAARECWPQIVRAHIDNDTQSGWLVAGVGINWEDVELTCAHSGKPIECAYA